MDKRTTLAINETFVELLRQCMENNHPVSMLVDDHGISRIEGYVQQIELDSTIPWLALDNGAKVIIKNIKAVNGLFDPSYSEC